MDRRYHNKNGFTLVEMMVVLGIVCMLGFGVYAKLDSSLYLFMKKVQTLCITAQEKAYVEHKNMPVILDMEIKVGQTNISVPSNITCESISFYYNEKGNISKAGSWRCHNGLTTMKLVFQLGTGRVRLEKE